MYWMAILSVNYEFKPELFKQAISCNDIKELTDAEVKTLTGCDPGVIPPIGKLFDM